MNWKVISRVQRYCADLPVGGEAFYYAIQRFAGGLKHGIDLAPYLVTASDAAARLRRAGIQIEGASVMEIGTGHALGVPLGFYLCGAASVHTFDLHRYLKPGLVMESLRRALHNLDPIRNVFLPLVESSSLESRLQRLFSVSSVEELMSVTGISYRAPADATNTALPDGSIDIQFSNNVFEHVPPRTLQRILLEGSRVLSKKGCAYHVINPGDHFARYDPRIATINFLRFSESDWEKLAGNQFAYHNRLRAYAYRDIYEEARHDILEWQEIGDAAALRVLQSGFPVDPGFQGSPEELSIIRLEVLSRPLQ
jgi:hypothetical protein